MPGEVDLSVIIINWNSKEFLRKCLASIYAGTRGLNFEIIVVDNASFDGCDQLLSKEFPKVRFIQSQENLGFARANNLGFQHSSGRNLLFLNPDTEVIEPAIQRLQACLESAADAGAVGARLLNSDLSVQISCIRTFPSILNEALDTAFLRRMFPKSALWGTRPLLQKNGGPVPVDVISGACLMIQRSVFEQVGQFSTSYFMYSEDIDLCYMVKRAGKNNYYLDGAAVIHHGGRSSGCKPDNNFTAVMMRESKLKFFRKQQGRLYASLYRSMTVSVAVCRLFLLGMTLLLTVGSLRRNSLYAGLAKWTRVFRWAVGLESWSKDPRRWGRK